MTDGAAVAPPDWMSARGGWGQGHPPGAARQAHVRPAGWGL